MAIVLARKYRTESSDYFSFLRAGSLHPGALADWELEDYAGESLVNLGDVSEEVIIKTRNNYHHMIGMDVTIKPCNRAPRHVF